MAFERAQGHATEGPATEGRNLLGMVALVGGPDPLELLGHPGRSYTSEPRFVAVDDGRGLASLADPALM